MKWLLPYSYLCQGGKYQRTKYHILLYHWFFFVQLFWLAIIKNMLITLSLFMHYSFSKSQGLVILFVKVKQINTHTRQKKQVKSQSHKVLDESTSNCNWWCYWTYISDMGNGFSPGGVRIWFGPIFSTK